MQSQVLMFMFLMLFVIPLMILSANHNLFFIVVAFILLISSMRNIQTIVFSRYSEPDDEYDDLADEAKEISNIDIKKFGVGTKVVQIFIIILFFVYCSFYLNILWTKIAVSLVILYWVHCLIHRILKEHPFHSRNNQSKLGLSLEFAVHVGMILVILLAIYNKYVKV